MSQRTLLEFNHDQASKIERDPAPFLSALGDLMRGGPSDHNLIVLGAYGLTWRGQRHHGDEFSITWGGHKVTEPTTRQTGELSMKAWADMNAMERAALVEKLPKKVCDSLTFGDLGAVYEVIRENEDRVRRVGAHPDPITDATERAAIGLD